jgi:hypothetical protein
VEKSEWERGRLIFTGFLNCLAHNGLQWSAGQGRRGHEEIGQVLACHEGIEGRGELGMGLFLESDGGVQQLIGKSG